MSRTAVVRIFESELRVLVDEMASHPHIETGGDLFGLWSHGDTPTIFLASRPGPRAVRDTLSFQQDVASPQRVEKHLWAHLGLQCVGMWHSHHRIGLPVLSRGDLGRTMRYARRSHRNRFVDVLGYFTHEWVLRPFLYEDPALGRTQQTRIEILPGVSPLRTQLAARLPELRGAPIGPTVAWNLSASEPQSPAVAPREGSVPVDLEALAAPAGPSRGPWRGIDAVERVVGQVVPEPLLESMELDIIDKHHFALKLSYGPRRTLVAMLKYDGVLKVDAWEIVGEHPVVGTPNALDSATVLRRAVSALEHG